MSLTIEDGSGVTGADSFATVAEAETFYTDYDKDSTAWLLLTTAVKEAKLRVAARYIESKYNFQGVQSNSTQNLAWPRTGVYVDGVGRLFAPERGRLSRAGRRGNHRSAGGHRQRHRRRPVAAGYPYQ